MWTLAFWTLIRDSESSIETHILCSFKAQSSPRVKDRDFDRCPSPHHDEWGAKAIEGADAKTHQTSHVGLGGLFLPCHQGSIIGNLPEQLHEHLASGCPLSQSTVIARIFPCPPLHRAQRQQGPFILPTVKAPTSSTVPGTYKAYSMSTQQSQPLASRGSDPQHLNS